MILLFLILVFVLIHFSGFLIAMILKINSDNSSQFKIGLITLISCFALFQTGFKSIFLGLFICLIWYFVTIYKKSDFVKPVLNIKKLLFNIGILSTILIIIKSFLILNPELILEHDSLYLVQVSWGLQEYNIESLINDHINTESIFRTPYHYFSPWFINFCDALSFNFFLNYDILLFVVYPILLFTIIDTSKEILIYLGLSNKASLLLSFFSIFTFCIYFNFFEKLPFIGFSKKMTYGASVGNFNSIKNLESLILLTEVLKIFILKKSQNLLFFLLGVLCFISPISIPTNLSIIVIYLLFKVLNKRISVTHFFILILYPISIYLFFSLFYIEKTFIPSPNILKEFLNLIYVLKTNYLKIFEDLISFYCVYIIPILLFLFIVIKRNIIDFNIRKNKLLVFLSLFFIVSFFYSILFSSSFVGSQFFNYYFTVWFNYLVFIFISFLLIKSINTKKYLVSFLLSSYILISATMGFVNGTFYEKSELAINYETKSISSLNNKRKLILVNTNKIIHDNPFVFHHGNYLYRHFDNLKFISISNYSNPEFNTHKSGSLAKFDPIYKFISKKKIRNFSQLIDELNKTLEISVVINNLENKDINNVLKSKQKKYLYQILK